MLQVCKDNRAPFNLVLPDVFASFSLQSPLNYLSFFTQSAAEGRVDCLLLLVNREQIAGIIDCQDTQGQ